MELGGKWLNFFFFTEESVKAISKLDGGNYIWKYSQYLEDEIACSKRQLELELMITCAWYWMGHMNHKKLPRIHLTKHEVAYVATSLELNNP